MCRFPSWGVVFYRLPWDWLLGSCHLDVVGSNTNVLLVSAPVEESECPPGYFQGGKEKALGLGLLIVSQ